MNKIIAAFAVALCMTAFVTAYSDNVQTDLQSNMIRLHIIANSDSDEDQNVKLMVRDAVLKETGSKLADEDKEICKDNIVCNLDAVKEIADRVLAENGFDYASYVQYGKFAFPEKTYKSMILPAGDYYGVRIVLGEGKGHNWWCVMYPPLCFREGQEVQLSKESEKILREKLDKDTYDIITKKDDKVVVKLKIVELIQNIKQKMRK